MEKVLVYENGQVNEYGVVYDQEYMDILLEEYRKSFSVLREGSVLTRGACNKDAVKNIVHYFDDVVSFGVATSDIEGCYQLSFIGAINPVVYNLLKGPNNEFSLSNKQIHSILHWCEALEHRNTKEKKFTCHAEAPINDFIGLDEKADVVNNISGLLEDVSLEYIGKKEQATAYEVETAKIGTRFVEKFNVSRVIPNQLKK